MVSFFSFCMFSIFPVRFTGGFGNNQIEVLSPDDLGPLVVCFFDRNLAAAWL